ncbi:hypothetical protein DPMN_004432 [Dreissena polymorpha]|uniref:Uncharacterized protein n=1 Tax=Dreissena polymorpha TaxID=45954 RepID=A0A9D4RSZ9_DREPO|nr:hypothetical protein DPMN_004432 [Dreissena polymorpha]
MDDFEGENIDPDQDKSTFTLRDEWDELEISSDTSISNRMEKPTRRNNENRRYRRKRRI